MLPLNDIPQVALDCLNKDHHDVANIVKQLDAHLNDATIPSNNISEIVKQLVEHLENHFACEEYQMEKYHFPALPLHRSEHLRVMDEIKQVQADWLAANNNEALQDYLASVFCPWLVEHITTFDTQTARYIVDSGGS